MDITYLFQTSPLSQVARFPQSRSKLHVSSTSIFLPYNEYIVIYSVG